MAASAYATVNSMLPLLLHCSNAIHNGPGSRAANGKAARGTRGASWKGGGERAGHIETLP